MSYLFLGLIGFVCASLPCIDIDKQVTSKCYLKHAQMMLNTGFDVVF